jgi:hypothetical protein
MLSADEGSRNPDAIRNLETMALEILCRSIMPVQTQSTVATPNGGGASIVWVHMSPSDAVKIAAEIRHNARVVGTSGRAALA